MSVRYRPGIIQDRLTASQRAILRAGNQALDKTIGDAQQKFDAVVATWANQPTFEITSINTATTLSRTLMIHGVTKSVKIFGWVDKGTKPHIIRPKKPGGFLAFKGGYNPKTQFKARFGGPGKATGKTQFTRLVLHPGTKAREFTSTYREEAVIQLRKEVIRALNR